MQARKAARAPQANLLLASGQANPGAIAVDTNSAYWTNLADGNSANGTVMKVPLGGGAATTLACGQSDPSGIAVDATSVYWTNPISGTVMKLPK